MKTYKQWGPAELDFVQENAKKCTDQELASQLSEMTGEEISREMIRRQRRKMGIEKQRGRRANREV